MDLTSRRKLIRNILPDEGGDISSDGRTVWFNRGICMARFCPGSREYAGVGANESRTGLEYPETGVRHPEDGPSSADWDDFVNAVNDRWGIVIGQEHTPLYIPRAENVRTTETSSTP